MKKYLLILVAALVFAGCSSQKLSLVKCNDTYNKPYSVEGNLEFCYKEAWGQPATQEIPAEIGKAYHIGFDVAGKNAPEIIFQTQDFKPKNPSSINFCYDCMDTSLEKEQLLGNLIENFKDPQGRFYLDATKTTLEKVTLANKPSFKTNMTIVIKNQDAKQNTEMATVVYYIPKAFDNENYNLSLSSIPDDEKELDEFVKTLSFK